MEDPLIVPAQSCQQAPILGQIGLYLAWSVVEPSWSKTSSATRGLSDGQRDEDGDACSAPRALDNAYRMVVRKSVTEEAAAEAAMQVIAQPANGDIKVFERIKEYGVSAAVFAEVDKITAVRATL